MTWEQHTAHGAHTRQGNDNSPSLRVGLINESDIAIQCEEIDFSKIQKKF